MKNIELLENQSNQSISITTPSLPNKPFSLNQISQTTRGLFLLGLAILIWGANWPVMKVGLHHISPIWFSATRFALGGLTLFVLQIATRTLRLPTRRDLPLIFSVGLLQMLAFTLLSAFAIMSIPAGRSAILAYTTPLWVTPIAILVFRAVVSKREITGILLGIVGVLILFNPMTLDWSNPHVLLANLMLLGASACWAICILHLRYYRGDSNAYHLAPWQMLVATVPLTCIAWWFEGPYTGDGSSQFWQVALFVGPLATAFCFCAVNAANSWLSSTMMANAMLGVPVVGLIMSVLFLGEKITLGLLLGVIAIIGGMAISTLKKAKSSSANQVD